MRTTRMYDPSDPRAITQWIRNFQTDILGIVHSDTLHESRVNDQARVKLVGITP